LRQDLGGYVEEGADAKNALGPTSIPPQSIHTLHTARHCAQSDRSRLTPIWLRRTGVPRDVATAGWRPEDRSAQSTSM